MGVGKGDLFTCYNSTLTSSTSFEKTSDNIRQRHYVHPLKYLCSEATERGEDGQDWIKATLFTECLQSEMGYLRCFSLPCFYSHRRQRKWYFLKWTDKRYSCVLMIQCVTNVLQNKTEKNIVKWRQFFVEFCALTFHFK